MVRGFWINQKFSSYPKKPQKKSEKIEKNADFCKKWQKNRKLTHFFLSRDDV